MLSGKDFDFSTNFMFYILISLMFLVVFYSALEEVKVTLLDNILMTCFFIADMCSLLSYTGIWGETKI